MEQFFVILAIIVFWVFRGVAGSQRRVPGQDPYESESNGPGGHIDISSAARQKTLESQQRAIEALQRWEAKQGLSAAKGDPGRPGEAPGVPAISRTRVGRPATAGSRAAAWKRKEAFADIARMLDPAEQTSPVPAAKPAAERTRSDAALRRESVREDKAAQKVEASRRAAAAQEAAASGDEKTAPLSTLDRLEKLPLAARAIVYAEILGPPRSLS
jgi:hypothetical protein